MCIHYIGRKIGFFFYRCAQRYVQSQLEIPGMLPHSRYYKEGAAIIKEFFKKGSIAYAAYSDMVGPEIGRKLLETNVFLILIRLPFSQL